MDWKQDALKLARKTDDALNAANILLGVTELTNTPHTHGVEELIQFVEKQVRAEERSKVAESLLTPPKEERKQ